MSLTKVSYYLINGISVNVLDYGADPTGVADSTAAIQAAIDTGAGSIYIPVGTYLVSDELTLGQRQMLYGEGSASWTGSNKKSILQWSGSADSTKAVLRLSLSAVGIEPSPLSGIIVENLVLDANDLAGYGLYCAYVTGDSKIRNIAAIKATEHCIWIGKSWYASYEQMTAYLGRKNGITIGDSSVFGSWASQVNGIYVANLRGHGNGLDEDFDETTNPYVGYGVGLFGCADVTIRNVVAENNDGCGVLMRQQGRPGPAVIDGGYMEGNTETAVADGRATINYGLIFAPSTPFSARQWAIVRDVYMFTDSNAQTVWLTDEDPNNGTNPRFPQFHNVRAAFVADYDSYQLHNCNLSISQTGAGVNSINSGISSALFTIPMYNSNSNERWGQISYYNSGSDGTSKIHFYTERNSSRTDPDSHTYSMSRSAFLPSTDGTQDLGSASLRFDTVFATTGAIDTSDANEKQQIADLTESEREVAATLKQLIKTFKFNNAVETKGDKARIHVGVIAQDVEKAFVDAGLDPEQYGMFCRDVWYEYNGKPVEVDENQKYVEEKWVLNGRTVFPDEEGKTLKGTEHVVTLHDTVRRERLGIRYDELLAFVVSAI